MQALFTFYCYESFVARLVRVRGVKRLRLFFREQQNMKL